jgi:hypothetical protein
MKYSSHNAEIIHYSRIFGSVEFKAQKGFSPLDENVQRMSARDNKAVNLEIQ